MMFIAPIPTVEDICKTLSPDNAEIVKRLEDSLTGMKVRERIKPLRGIVSDFKWKVEFWRGAPPYLWVVESGRDRES